MAEIWRLAQLRPSSSSETIAQIQRVAERLCQFIMGYESGYILPEASEEEEEEDEEARRRRRIKKRRKKKRTTVEEVEEEEEGREGIDDNEEEEEEEDDEDDGSSLASPALKEPAKPSMTPMSPFGFDFFSHTNFEWQPAPSSTPQPAQQKPQPSFLISPNPSTDLKDAVASQQWSCPACTFVNADDKDKCEICGHERHQDMGDEKDSQPPHVHAQHEEKKDEAEAEDLSWECEACSFKNRPEAEQCEVCETRRGAKFIPAETGDGMEGTQKEGLEGREGKEGEPGGEADEKEGSTNSGSSEIGASNSQIPGSWSCSYCTWLNPPLL